MSKSKKRTRVCVPINALAQSYRGKQWPPIYGYLPLSSLVLVSLKVYRRIKTGEPG